jgi:hypothetical protein
MARTRETVDRAFRGLALPIVLLLLVTVAVDHWARDPGSAGEPARADVEAPP